MLYTNNLKKYMLGRVMLFAVQQISLQNISVGEQVDFIVLPFKSASLCSIRLVDLSVYTRIYSYLATSFWNISHAASLCCRRFGSP